MVVFLGWGRPLLIQREGHILACPFLAKMRKTITWPAKEKEDEVTWPAKEKEDESSRNIASLDSTGDSMTSCESTGNNSFQAALARLEKLNLSPTLYVRAVDLIARSGSFRQFFMIFRRRQTVIKVLRHYRRKTIGNTKDKRHKRAL